MIQKISQVVSPGFYPYYNLALEKYLFDHVDDNEIILYLWQNERTVVCGRNQNLWKECNVTHLLEDGQIGNFFKRRFLRRRRRIP